MDQKLDYNLLVELINDCRYISQTNQPTQAQVKTFYDESVLVVNSYEKVFPAQCAKVELLWHLYKLQSMALQLAAQHMAVALTEIQNQFQMAIGAVNEKMRSDHPKFLSVTLQRIKKSSKNLSPCSSKWVSRSIICFAVPFLDMESRRAQGICTTIFATK